MALPLLAGGAQPCYNTRMPRLDYLVIGHVAKDIVPGGHALGGTVTYAAITAHRLGLRAGIVTAADEGFIGAVSAATQGIALHARPSPQTTTFENIYGDAGRTQFLRARADPLTIDDVPAEWRDARIVHLGPLVGEVDAGMLRQFTGALVALTPQGWLRQWDAAGRVSPRAWDDALAVLSQVDVLIFSPEDVGHNWDLIHAYTRAAPLAVLTLERHGALVFRRDEGRWIMPREARVVDPTGAGDVFAAAFLAAYQEQRDAFAAARFANVAASFSIEGHGVSAIPNRLRLQRWFKQHEEESLAA